VSELILGGEGGFESHDGMQWIDTNFWHTSLFWRQLSQLMLLILHSSGK